MNNKNKNFEDNKNNIENQKNEIIAFYEIDNRKIKILGTEFVKNNKYNFDFFINGYLSNMRDELDKTYWKEDDHKSLISISEASDWNTDYIVDMSFMLDD